MLVLCITTGVFASSCSSHAPIECFSLDVDECADVPECGWFEPGYRARQDELDSYGPEDPFIDNLFLPACLNVERCDQTTCSEGYVCRGVFIASESYTGELPSHRGCIPETLEDELLDR